MLDSLHFEIHLIARNRKNLYLVTMGLQSWIILQILLKNHNFVRKKKEIQALRNHSKETKIFIGQRKMNTFRNSILKKTAKDSKGKRKHVVIKFDVIKRHFV